MSGQLAMISNYCRVRDRSQNNGDMSVSDMTLGSWGHCCAAAAGGREGGWGICILMLDLVSKSRDGSEFISDHNHFYDKLYQIKVYSPLS